LLNAFAKNIIMKTDYVLKKACLKNTWWFKQALYKINYSLQFPK
jgi:hypothetical protein